MSLLCDRVWKLKYTPDDGDLVTRLYVPALECAVRYDRLTGYFCARALTLAARGLEGLIRNFGRMRLLVGCTLDQPEVEAIAKGAECRDQVKAHLLANPVHGELLIQAAEHQISHLAAVPNLLRLALL
jgi:hypothetical protein